MLIRRAGRFVLVVAMAATITAVVDHRPPPAGAADPDVLISAPPAPGGGGSINFQVSSLGGSTTVVNPGDTVPVKQLCVPASTAGVGDFCLGTSDVVLNESDTDPVEIGGFASQPAGLPGEAMDWLIPDAEASVAIQHGVKDDDMIRTYARPEVRTQVAARIMTILNKKLYGKTLTPEEENVYQAVKAAYRQRQTDQATWALTEYNAWVTDPCAYVPPAPPAGSGLAAVPNPVRDSSACSKVGALSQQYKFTNGTPPVSTFDAWAAYRHATPSMTHANDPTFRRMSVANVSAIVLTVGTGLATAAGIGTGFAAVAYATTVAASVAETLSILSETAITTAEVLAEMVPTIGGLISAVAGSVVAIVGGIIIGAIAIYQLVEDMKPGQQLNERVRNAPQQSDPLGIEGRMADYAGLDMKNFQEPAGQPKAFIHEADFFRQILAQVNEWLMFTQGGTLIADPITGYTAESTADDYRFLVDGVPQPFIQLLAPVGAVGRTGTGISGYRVRFSRGWLMVAEVATGGAVGPYAPRLSVDFLDPSGNKGQMTLINHGNEGETPQLDFQLAKPHPDGTETATFEDSWSFRRNTTTNQTVTLQTSQPALPVINVVPSAEGDMVADHNVLLKTNASTGTPTVGTSYTWELQRLDASGNPVETIPVAPDTIAFQHRFATPGRYRAKVTVSGNTGTPFSVAGRVEFTIREPEPELIQAEVRDGQELGGALSLNLNLVQNTRSDTFDVGVDWATDGTGTPLTHHYTVQCVDTGFDTCNTGTLVAPANAPTNPQWSESPTFTIPAGKNYLPYVNVTITNSYGQVIKRVFPIEVSNDRPTYEDDHPAVVMPAGADSLIDVVQIHPASGAADPDLTLQSFQGQIVAQLPEGVLPNIEKKPNGEWWLQLQGSPSADDIGEHTFYFPFEQEPIGSGLRPPPALVNLEIKAAVAPGYRAILRGAPAKFTDRFYRNVYPPYQVQVAQVLAEGQSTFAPFTGTVKCRLDAGPTTYFDKPCAQDKPFPWPAEKISDNLIASVYVESATQQVSADGHFAASLHTDFLDPRVTSPNPSTNALTRSFTLQIADPGFILPPWGPLSYTVACSQDGKAFAACFGNSTGTTSLYRTPGNHTLRVKVTAPDNATTTVTFPWVVTLPAKTLGLKLPVARKKRGTTMTVAGSLLLPQESYKITIGGIVVATGKASNLGRLSRSVRIPARLAPRKYAVQLTGGRATRKVVRYLTVTR